MPITRLRFIRRWSTYGVGDIMETSSPWTVERLVRHHKVAEVDRAVTLASLIEREQYRAESTIRAITEPPADKMVRAAGQAKMRNKQRKRRAVAEES